MQTAFDAGAQGVGLLPDFLEHEVGETTFLQLVEREAQGVHLGGLVDVGQVDDINLAAAVHVGNLLVLEIDDLLGVFHDGGGVGAEVELFLSACVGTHSDDQGAALPGAHQLVGMLLLQNGDGIGTDDVLQRTLYGGEQAAFAFLLGVFNQLHQHLGVGFAAELVAFLLEHGAQGLVVLDNTIVHQREVAALAQVRVGIDGVGLAVGGPAGVGDADAARGILGGTFLLKSRHFAGGFVDVEVAFGVDHTYSGRVVAAVFQSMKALYQNRVSFLLTDVSYYSTHNYFF